MHGPSTRRQVCGLGLVFNADQTGALKCFVPQADSWTSHNLTFWVCGTKLSRNTAPSQRIGEVESAFETVAGCGRQVCGLGLVFKADQTGALFVSTIVQEGLYKTQRLIRPHRLSGPGSFSHQS